MLHRWEPPSTFSVFLRDRHRPPNSPGHRRARPRGSPRHDLHRVSHCREVANTARRLLFMFRRSFCELSKTAFTPLYCAWVRPHLEYAMEANAPTLRVDINHFERVQGLAARLVRGLRQVNLFSLECRRLRADLILAFKIFNGEVDLNPSEFFLRPPRAGLRGYPYRLLQGPSRLRRRSGAFSVRVVKYWNRLPAHLVLSPSVSIFKKTVGPSLVRNLPGSTCVTSVSIHWQFSKYCYHRLFMFFLTSNPPVIFWTFLVDIPTLGKSMTNNMSFRCYLKLLTHLSSSHC